MAYVSKDGVCHGDGASAALEHRADDRPEQNDDADGTACVPETGGDGVGDLEEGQPRDQPHEERHGEEGDERVDLELRYHEDHNDDSCGKEQKKHGTCCHGTSPLFQ